MSHLLQPGVLLDDRYRIEHVLGEGGFGITYAAVNTRIGLKVAIKELFWKNHSVRDAAVSPEVVLSQEQDASVFQEQKERFLREARTLRDFSQLSGVVHVIDYFELNGTAYIVMERIEGETLSSILSREGATDAEKLLRSALPLIESLDKIHQAGVIHRDISPDNIMVQQDGCMTLIDFGAARQFEQQQPKPYTTIAKVSYSPGEQYDKNGKQGPWTDVYSLCATLYHCIVGTAPVGAVQRMFLDELKTPSEMGVSILPKYENILMKGLQLDSTKRYQTMQELAQAIRDALPDVKPASSRGLKQILIGVAAGVVCVAAILGVFLWRKSVKADKFRGIETERLYITANSEMSASEFADSQENVERWLEMFAGPDNFLMSVSGTHIDVTLPLEVYENREIFETTVNSYNEFIDSDGEKLMQLDAQIQADWEATQSNLLLGQNQVRPEELQGETLLLVFGPNKKITRSAWIGMIMDFKTRLDALDTPYAFGTLYGDDRQFVVRISPERIGRVILDTIGSYCLYLAGEYSGMCKIYCSYNGNKGASELAPLETDGQICGIRYTQAYDFNTDLEKLTRAMLDLGENTVYLQSYNSFPIAKATINHVIDDGTIDFTEFCFSDFDRITPDTQWVIDYIDALMNRTDLSETCYLNRTQVLDKEGNVLFEEKAADHYGLFVYNKTAEQELIHTLQTLAEETGYSVSQQQNSSTRRYFISLDLDANEDLPKQIAKTVPELLKKYGLTSFHTDSSIIITFVSEQRAERCRLAICTTYDYTSDTVYNYASLVCYGGTRLTAYYDQIQEWWNSFDAESLGLSKELR